MLLKPEESMLCNLLKRAGLFEKMGGTGHDHQSFRAGEKPIGCEIHVDDRLVVSSDNQHRRRGDRRQIGFGQIRSAAPRHDSQIGRASCRERVCLAV